MLKRIARGILFREIESLEEKAKHYENRNIELRGEMVKKENKLKNEKLELEKEIVKLQSEKAESERKSEELEKENEVLRKYYDLDKEPSDEIKMKIHIDLEINRLKEENMSLKCMFLFFETTNVYTTAVSSVSSARKSIYLKARFR